MAVSGLIVCDDIDSQRLPQPMNEIEQRTRRIRKHWDKILASLSSLAIITIAHENYWMDKKWSNFPQFEDHWSASNKMEKTYSFQCLIYRIYFPAN